MNPVFKPIFSDEYGKRATTFFVSPICNFQGKLWQLRTVRYRGAYYVAPFIINGGAVSATQPIVSKSLISFIGAEHSNVDKSFAVDTSLGALTTFSEWDYECEKDVTAAPDALMFNLLGHGLADHLHQIDSWAHAVADKDISMDLALRRVAKSSQSDVAAHIARNEDLVRRELEATVDAHERKLANGDVLLHEYASRFGFLSRSPSAIA